MYQYLGDENYNKGDNNYNTNYYNTNYNNKKLFYGYNTKSNNNNSNNNGQYYSIDYKDESNNSIDYNTNNFDVNNNNSYGYKDVNNFNSYIREKNDINQIVFNTVDIGNYQNIENQTNSKHERNKKNTFIGKNKETLDDKNNIQNISSSEIDEDNEEEFQSDVNQAEVLQNRDHNELITPTYITMFFNATSIIPLNNVGKMIKDEPIETINESYDTCETNNTKHNSTECIPIIDLCSLVSDNP